MFCSHCGKQIDDHSAFCKYCGNSINGGSREPSPDTDFSLWQKKKTDTLVNYVFLILMILVTLFQTFTIFYPVISVSAVWYNDQYTIMQLWKMGRELLDTTSRIFLGVATAAGVVAAIAGFCFFVNLLNGAKARELTASANVCSWACINQCVVFIIIRIYCNAKLLDDYELLSNPVIMWVLLVTALLNIFVFTTRYENGIERSIQERKQYTDKVCKICKTSYLVGNRCPKCGSTQIEE